MANFVSRRFLQASALAHEIAGNRMGAAQSVDAPLGLQRHLTVPLFATSAVTGSGIPLLHAFLASLRSTGQPHTSALVSSPCPKRIRH